MNNLYIILSILLLVNCSYKEKGVAQAKVVSDTIVTSEVDIEEKIKSMQSNIDSATALYSLAINDRKSGLKKEEVFKRYSDRIMNFHQGFSKTFDTVTSLYMQKKISQSEYDKVMSRLNLKGIQNKSLELEKLGVKISP